MHIPSYLWLLGSYRPSERVEDFYCRVEQCIFILCLPIALLWQLWRQYNMVKEVECYLETERGHSDKSQDFASFELRLTME